MDTGKDIPSDKAPDTSATCDSPPGTGSATSAIHDPSSKDFFATPFPSNARRTAKGTIDFAGFPNPAESVILQNYLDFATDNLTGFSVVPVIYFAFDGDVDVTGLDPTYVPANHDAALQIVDLTAGPDLGKRLPVEWEYRAVPGSLEPAHLLKARPLLGFPLKEDHTYAALATSALKGKDGLPIGRALAFEQALEGTLDGADLLVKSLEPLRAWLAGEPCLANEIVTGTVFTVGRPTADLHRIRSYIRNDLGVPQMVDVKLASSTEDYDLYEGHYVAPNFLTGTPPYDNGGGFEFSQDGAPVVQAAETLRFAITVPRGKSMPAAGWPIVLMSHGTGGSWKSFITSGSKYKMATVVAKDGLAAMGIDQPLHGTRCDPPLSKDVLELYSYNFVNPEAGRTVQRQSVADEFSRVRMIEAGQIVIPASVSAAGRDERFDPGRILFLGHSQGGTTGGMLLALEDHVRGGVLSGAGGGISLTLILRKDPVDIREMIAGQIGMTDPTELTAFHPVASLVQTIADPTDPIAYAAFYFSATTGDASATPRHVLLTEGMKDQFTPPATTEVMASIAGIPVLAPCASCPLGLTAKGIPPTDLPVIDNIAAPGGGKATGLLIQFPESDHYAVYTNAMAAEFYREFLDGLAHDGKGHVGM